MISEFDETLSELIKAEEARQARVLRMIPSENIVSDNVLEALGSVLTNKYSEGYPGKRYYQGQAVLDQIERLAQERARALFGAEHANVQSYSGSPANMAAYMAVCQPGDPIVGLGLNSGARSWLALAIFRRKPRRLFTESAASGLRTRRW